MYSQQDIFNLIKNTFGQNSVLTVPVIFLKKLDGNYEAAVFLSQLIYWSNKTDNTDGWIYKSYAGWEKELFLKEKKVREIKNRLLELRLIKTKLQKVNGAPTLHYKVDFEVLAEFLKTQESVNYEKPAETKPLKLPNGNGKRRGNVPPEDAETSLPKQRELLSNIDYSIDYSIDYVQIPQKKFCGQAVGDSEYSKPKDKPQSRLSLQDREPVNDLEIVEKEYLKQWNSLYELGILKTQKPVINWVQSRKLLKKCLTNLSPDVINKAIQEAKKDSFILSGGFSLTTILSASVLNKLINSYYKTPEPRQTMYRRSAIIPGDRITEYL